MFSDILFHANLYFENSLENFTFGGYTIELSVYAFIGMKYDSANFSFPLHLMDAILIQLLVQHMSEISHTCLKQLFH